ncbi:MAG: hypothetical protein HN348_27635, partial [Proteobacteria bacterium]|nr:hypothetical protein [Pseudomonadota bacterium]
MADYGGMTLTGRQLRETASDLFELENGGGMKHLAITYRQPYAGHPVINQAVTLCESFLEYPMVAGLVELSHHNIDEGTFVYPTGQVWMLTEVLRKYRDVGQVLGLRAALEMCYVAGNILREAAENGSFQGVYAHGDLAPSRICLNSDGQVQLIGYGLPQVEIHVHREDESQVIDVNSLHYCPPERLEGNLEDVDADFYALVLVAIEMITGKPLYDGPLDKVKEMVAMSQGPQMLLKLKKLIPPKTMDMFRRALIYDPDRRFTSAEDFLDEVRAVLDEEGDGKSLSEIVERMAGKKTTARGRGKPTRKVVTAASTTAFTTDQLKAMAEAMEEEEEEEEAPKPEKRWGKVARKRGKEEEEEEEEEAKPARRGRRTAAKKEEEEAKPARRGRRTATKEEKEEAKPTRGRRPSAASAKSEEAEAEAEAEAEPTRRRRPTKDDDGEAKPTRRRRPAAKDD